MTKHQHQAQKKQYHGVYPCTFHDFLAEMLALKPDTLCKSCYKDIAKFQVQHIAAVMVQMLLMKRQIGELYAMHEDSKIKLDATMQAFGEYQVEMEERLNELSSSQGPAALSVLQATYISEAKFLRKQLQAIADLFAKVDPAIDTKQLTDPPRSPKAPESTIVPIGGNNGNGKKPRRKKS